MKSRCDGILEAPNRMPGSGPGHNTVYPLINWGGGAVFVLLGAVVLCVHFLLSGNYSELCTEKATGVIMTLR